MVWIVLPILTMAAVVLSIAAWGFLTETEMP